MRIFIALDLDKNHKEQLKNIIKKIKKSFTSERWIPEKNWHITLFFLGNIYDKMIINNIADSLEIIADNNTIINSNINKIDFAPPQTIFKRMIWAYIDKTKELENLRSNLQLLLTKINIINKSKNNFLPHINLARLKNYYKNIKIDKKIDLKIKLEQISLYQSTLKQEGAEYTIIKSVKLKN